MVAKIIKSRNSLLMFDPITEELLELEEALKEKNDEFLLAIKEIQNRVNFCKIN
ncbi:MAG: hypothetical protein ACFFD7_11120 [Candidatus Thorarchaeota archaeon]